MRKIAIVGGGPKAYIPNLENFNDEDLLWIGADQGAEVLIDCGITPDVAVGDFDSVDVSSFQQIKQRSKTLLTFSEEKNETDLEIAIDEALKRTPDHILLFGVTGGRMDHTLANIQLLYPLLRKGVRGTIIDQQNQVELVEPGEHKLERHKLYPYVSFLPVSLEVNQLTLDGFYYPLRNAHLPYGSTLCLSNQLIQDLGTFLFASGILLIIRSKDLT